MSNTPFALSAVGMALLVPALAFGLFESGPSYPTHATRAAAAAAAVVHEMPAPLKQAPQTIQLEPMVVGARAVAHKAQKVLRSAARVDCDSSWHALSQGPKDRHVRNICPPVR